jgi:dolichyl-phosphate beta-glucosyltransferase
MESPTRASDSQSGDEHRLAGERDAPPALSIVIPAFNEAGRIGSTLAAITACPAIERSRVEILVVDDGSSDATAERAFAFAAGLESDASHACSIRVISGEEHRGKGHAVRRGMLSARGEVILMCDADLSTPLDQIDRLRPWLDGGYDVVIGSRRMDDSILDPPQPRSRRVMDAVFRAIRTRCVLPEIRDTQCGFKCFTRDAARAIFTRAVEDGFVFDCEVLALARRLGHRIKEVGVLWKNDPDSRVRPVRDSVAMLIGLWRIREMLRTTPLEHISERDKADRRTEVED